LISGQRLWDSDDDADSACCRLHDRGSFLADRLGASAVLLGRAARGRKPLSDSVSWRKSELLSETDQVNRMILPIYRTLPNVRFFFSERNSKKISEGACIFSERSL
jgi:hypothetical protein